MAFKGGKMGNYGIDFSKKQGHWEDQVDVLRTDLIIPDAYDKLFNWALGCKDWISSSSGITDKTGGDVAKMIDLGLRKIFDNREEAQIRTRGTLCAALTTLGRLQYTCLHNDKRYAVVYHIINKEK